LRVSGGHHGRQGERQRKDRLADHDNSP
jgi:hypothetical protein